MLLSGLLRTYNEDVWLPDTMPLMNKLCDEVIVADGGSTDDTKVVAEMYGAKWVDASDTIICSDPHLNHAGDQLNRGLEHCQGGWVYTQDVDLIPCERFVQHLRRTLKETKHDALLTYGVHLVGDSEHYAGEMSLGPGVVQLFRNKPGVQFPDQPEHAHLILDYPWVNLGIMQAGQFHYGYVDRDWELEKIALRAKALVDDDAYSRLAENPPQHKPIPVPWERCNPDCESCWMEEIAAEDMLERAILGGINIQRAIDFNRTNLAAASALGDEEKIELQKSQYEQQVTSFKRHKVRQKAIETRARELKGR